MFSPSFREVVLTHLTAPTFLDTGGSGSSTIAELPDIITARSGLSLASSVGLRALDSNPTMNLLYPGRQLASLGEVSEARYGYISTDRGVAAYRTIYTGGAMTVDVPWTPWMNYGPWCPPTVPSCRRPACFRPWFHAAVSS
jgi:hypothetical protein